MDKNKIQSFENKKVRSIWDAEKEEWFFSVVDVVTVLTDSENPTDYLKKWNKSGVKESLEYAILTNLMSKFSTLPLCTTSFF